MAQPAKIRDNVSEAMNDFSTGAMQNFHADVVGGRGASSEAALVLLYAENYHDLRPAYPLIEKKYSIGRSDDCDITLPVTAVSRLHASLERRGEQWCIQDHASTNGTLVDGRRIHELALEENAEVRVGDAVFKFVARGGRGYAEYPLVHAPRLSPAPQSRPLLGGFQMDQIRSDLEKVGPTDLSVLILGESGTGKEVTARTLHESSGRSGAFQAINCAALPENLIESELFGYKRGAFSGADKDKKGLVQVAHKGTLFLDEIGDMPAATQVKLLRVLQNREVFPVGATQAEPVDLRIIAATHKDLTRLQNEGLFRRDLYARLNDFQVHLPPLRDRKEDIYGLALSFLKLHSQKNYQMSFPFVAGLLRHDWPYNIRELESAIRRAAALCTDLRLREEHLPENVQEAILDYAAMASPRSRDESAPAPPSEEELRALLVASKGNIAEVGRHLGKARMQIHRWLSRYNIDIQEFRPAKGNSKPKVS
ncbi:MAG: sigma 54-interacting transcriptional regulator [Polyangiaceae bacterium]|nr:sigma 54-interacting transcriptional regulator [Polyangiaceae bacterium]